MPRGNRVRITLTPEEEQTLTVWANAGKTEQRMVRRAKVILFSARGYRLHEISAKSSLSRQNCSRWRERFLKGRMEGLKDEERSGRPRVISPEKRLEATKLACTKPKDGTTGWTTTSLAKATGLGRTTIHRILTEGRLKPHKVEYWCGKSPDPEFEEKQAAIVGLYLDPPDNAVVLCVDEKSQLQALDRTQPELPLRPGNAKRQTATYKRNGTTCLLAAFAVHSGEVTGRCVDRNDHTTFLNFLKHLYRLYPHKHLHVIADNLSLHKHAEVMEWAKRRRGLTLHFTPTYASWLNQVEIWFNIFSRDVIRGGIWKSKQQMVDQIMRYIGTHNTERKHPFKWTYRGKREARA
jgi:putative transposase